MRIKNMKTGKRIIILNAAEGSENYFGSKTYTFTIGKGIMRWIK